MLATSHALVGSILATHISNPVVAVVMIFLSHPSLDLFPHWDFNSRFAKRTKLVKLLISAGDSGLGMVLSWLIFGTVDNFIWLTMMVLLAQWADFLETPYHFGWEKVGFFAMIKKLQHWWHTKWGWPWGFLPQLMILLFALWLRFSYLLH